MDITFDVSCTWKVTHNGHWGIMIRPREPEREPAIDDFPVSQIKRHHDADLRMSNGTMLQEFVSGVNRVKLNNHSRVIWIMFVIKLGPLNSAMERRSNAKGLQNSGQSAGCSCAGHSQDASNRE